MTWRRSRTPRVRKSRGMRSRQRIRLAACLALAVGLGIVAPARAVVSCQAQAGPPGGETTVRIDIVDPVSPATIPPSAPCGQDVLISGTLAVTGPPNAYDIYIVVDASESTDNDSGAD